MAATDGQMETALVKVAEVERLLTDGLTKRGLCAEHAAAVVDSLVAADLRGHFSHGLNLFAMYVRLLEKGLIAKEGEPTVTRETVAIAHVDGGQLAGAVVAGFCMRLAITKAAVAGVGVVVANHSNHFGQAGHYARMALDRRFLGLAMTNASKLLIPTRAAEGLFGTNPIALAAPALDGDSFAFDMATTMVAMGKVTLAESKGQDVPEGWVLDKDAQPTRRPSDVHDGGLSPLGGVEITGGYKGYGLAMLVDVLTGALGDAAIAPLVQFMTTTVAPNVGHVFIALDPAAFAPGFEERMQSLLDACRNLQPTNPAQPVIVAGDRSRQHERRCQQLGGIPYPSAIIGESIRMATELGIEKLEILPCTSSP